MIFIGNDFGKAFDIGRKLTDRAFFASVTLKVCKFPAGNYMFKVNNRNTRAKCEICLKFKDTRTTLMASFWYLYC